MDFCKPAGLSEFCIALEEIRNPPEFHKALRHVSLSHEGWKKERKIIINDKEVLTPFLVAPLAVGALIQDVNVVSFVYWNVNVKKMF